MEVNIARPLLGELYSLYCSALGSTAAWWLGHITVIAIISLLYWVVTNWKAVIHGLGISGTRFTAWLALLALIGGQYLIYRDQFGFPETGAFLTATSTSLYLWWQWYQLEPQKA